jgi:lysophospholipase L1-like esterase
MKKAIYLFIFCFLLSDCAHKSGIKSATLPINVINEGVSGNTAENLLSRIDDIIIQKPNLVIIMVGTNDVKDGVSTFNSFGVTLSLIIDSLKHTGSSVMLLTPPPIATWSGYSVLIPMLNTLCDTIKNISITKGCYFVDVNSDLAQSITSANSHQMYVTDGLHPSAAGYLNIATYIFDYIKAKKITASKIICFGDSITYGVYVNGEGTATGETYPGVLSKDMNTPD